MEEQASTEVPDEVSPMPAGFYVVIWISVFMVITWGMMHLFGTHRRNAETGGDQPR